MITIYNEMFKNIPVLQVVQEQKMEDPLPTVVYFHGFRGEKDSGLTLAYKLALQGIRVILPDSLLHGERKENITQTELELSFWDIVIGNIEELEVIKNYLEEHHLLIRGQLGVGGTSMGGITTFSALRKYRWIKVAAVLMGTPKMTEYAQQLINAFNETSEEKISKEQADETLHKLKNYDLSNEPTMLKNRPLFIWHGDQDKVVPHEHSESFYKEVKNQYMEKDLIKMMKEKGRSHHISRLSIAETANWFTQHLI